MLKSFFIVFFFFQTFLFAQNNILKVQLRWYHQFQFAGFYAALHKGYYKNQGLDVELVEGGPSIQTVDEVLAKRAQFGISNSSLVLDFLHGKPLINLGSIMQHSPNVLLAQKQYKSPVDLAKGGAIALMGGDQDVELKAIFLQEGIDLSKVNFVPNKKHLEDFIEKKVVAINGYSSNEPYVLQQLQIPYFVLEPRSYGLDFYGDTLFTTREFVVRNKEMVEKFRQATFKGWLYALQNKNEIIELILRKYNTQNKTREQLLYEAEALYKIINPELVQIGHSNPGRWEHILHTYKLFGLAEGEKNLDQFYYKYDNEIDWKQFYLYFGLFLSVILALMGIVLYIFLINKRIKKTLQRQTILFENSASAAIVWNRTFEVTGWNTQAQKLFGWAKEEILGKNMFEFLVPKDNSSCVVYNLDMVMKENEKYIFQNYNLTKSGEMIKCEWHNTLLPQIDNEDQEIVAMAIDITQKDLEEKLLRKKAQYDPLTSLANRDYFEILLSQELVQSKVEKKITTVGFIDLDRFKEVNDTLGHDAGDHLLQVLSQRFEKTLQDKGVIGRVGGDEFIFFIESQTKIQEILEQLLVDASSDIVFADEALCVSASIGVYVVDASSSDTLSQILKKADTAMYEAKKSGKNRTVFY
jgi:diguanylate cyclase (GGDEF)-like protein/PAS domain S-box-containing protein